jgi:hypothetical protein
MASTAMAGSDETTVEPETEEVPLEEEIVDEEEDVEEVEEDAEDDDDEDEAEEEGLSQGAVHSLLTIDYKVPGNGLGTMTLVAVRGGVEVAFEAQIPWGLTDEEAIALIQETFGVQTQEAFGTEFGSFKVKDFSFDEETSVTTATILLIHGKAPVKMPKEIKVKAEEHNREHNTTSNHGKSKNK